MTGYRLRKGEPVCCLWRAVFFDIVHKPHPLKRTVSRSGFKRESVNLAAQRLTHLKGKKALSNKGVRAIQK
jgi:hypothetical protein